MQRFAVIDTETTWGIYWNLAPLYGVQPILRILSGDDQYEETHNAYFDAMDELRIVQLLGHGLDTYDDAILQGKKL